MGRLTTNVRIHVHKGDIALQAVLMYKTQKWMFGVLFCNNSLCFTKHGRLQLQTDTVNNTGNETLEPFPNRLCQAESCNSRSDYYLIW